MLDMYCRGKISCPEFDPTFQVAGSEQFGSQKGNTQQYMMLGLIYRLQFFYHYNLCNPTTYIWSERSVLMAEAGIPKAFPDLSSDTFFQGYDVIISLSFLDSDISMSSLRVLTSPLFGLFMQGCSFSNHFLQNQNVSLLE